MNAVLLEMRGISKDFFGVKALRDVNLTVRTGEILAIVGENGAGKSTLMNILSGTYPHGTYEGDIVFDGEKCAFAGIRDSEKKGIVIIHQELALIPYMSIAENIFLGNERKRAGVIDWNATVSEAKTYLKMVELNEDVNTLVRDIGIGKQQLVEIAKALAKKVRLLILDEPTAALNDKDSMHLLNLLLELKRQGVTCIAISHKLNEVCYVADRITVIRDGKTIETIEERSLFTEERIIRGMVGREMTDRFPRRDTQIGEVTFEIEHWRANHPVYIEQRIVDDVSIKVHRHEVVGIYGLMGAGRTELAMSVFGRSYGSNVSGTVKRDGKEVSVATVKEAIANGIVYIPEDRKNYGLNLIDTIKNNISIAGISQLARKGVVDDNREVMVANEYSRKLDIKSTGIDQRVESLSGGNQQKVVLSKWIFTKPRVLLLDEPTRGIDVGAKYEIYRIINQLVEDGAGAVFISSDLTEILGMCDRIYIMNEGKIVGEMPGCAATQTNIMQCIVCKSKAEG
ncbi:MAG: ATP-binding cassette domain-containing protein [Candidatus Limiplasma sp.]|nr:ATP-binding cassette domain-containing protein [Candidatus Limiplasma sp.]